MQPRNKFPRQIRGKNWIILIRIQQNKGDQIQYKFACILAGQGA